MARFHESKILLFLLLLFACISQVFASVSCSAETVTILDQSDADDLAACTAPSWINIVLDEELSGEIALDGIDIIKGNLTCQNLEQLTAVSAANLTAINGAFNLDSLTILSTLDFPTLVFVNTMNMLGLPALQALNFDAGPTVNNLLISNTQLYDLNGLNIVAADIVNINNNPYLAIISLPFTKVTQSLNIRGNSDQTEADFAQLQTAADMSLGNISELSVPQLSLVSGSLGIVGTSVQHFDLALLETVGVNFEILEGPDLSSVSAPALTSVGGSLYFDNTTKLHTIDLPSLVTASGTWLRGSFDDLTLGHAPVLGNISIVTTGALNCNKIATRLDSSQNGWFNCTSSSTSLYINEKNSTTPAVGTPSASSSGGLTTGAKIGIGVGVAVGAILVIAIVVLTFSLRRRRARRIASERETAATSSKPELSAATEIPRKELQEQKYQGTTELDGKEGKIINVELGGQERVEAPGSEPPPAVRPVHEMP